MHGENRSTEHHVAVFLFSPCPLETHSFEEMFAVVEFTEEREVEVVPVNWLSEDRKTCYWPAIKTQTKLKMAVLQMANPTDSFFPLPVKVLYQTENYAKAREKLKMAEDKSDLQTETEEDSHAKKRKRKAPHCFDEDDDESCDDDDYNDKTGNSQHCKESVTIRSSPRIGIPRKRIHPPLAPLPELPISTGPGVATPQLQESVQTSKGAPKLSTLFNKSKTSHPSTIQMKILTCLEQLKTQVHQNTKLLQALHKKVDAIRLTEEHKVTDIGIFLLKTKLALEELEEQLKSTEVFNQLLIQ